MTKFTKSVKNLLLYPKIFGLSQIIMALIDLKNISLAFGVAPILDTVNFSLETGERVCLIGRNGEGKSSLLKLIAGQLSADDGEILITDGTKIAMLAQDVPKDEMSVLDCVMSGNEPLRDLLSEYDKLTIACTNGDMTACQKMSELSHQIDNLHGWDFKRLANTIISNMDLTATDQLSALSGGKKRRVLLARALACQPDVLLLDEPTNHLDIQSIDWLENFLLSQNLTVLFISHDRKFVDNLATRIIELDRGKLSSYDVSQGIKGYARYQELKALELASEQKSFEEFDKKLAQEEVWIRQGIKARRTRNEGRVRALKKLREERQARRDVVGNIAIVQNNAEKSGKIVCEINNLTLKLDDKILVKNFSSVLMRGDKVGIIGANGVGKTTLIKAVLGLDSQSVVSGTVKLGTNLVVSLFDQLKADLDLEKSVAQNVSQGSDFVEINGKKTHILGYLQDFLFTPNRARTPVKALSGGEKARVMLARQLLMPANVLVLDEPTNDLDMATLELLEDYVANFDGTVLLISHDRSFMDNVVTQTWVFDTDNDGNGVIYEYVGGYDDYLSQHTAVMQNAQKDNFTKNTQTQNKAQNAKTQETQTQNAKQSTQKSSDKPQKLTYKQKRELEDLPIQIDELTTEQANLQALLADGSLFVSDFKLANQYSERLAQIDDLLLEKLMQWDMLDNLTK